MLDSRAGILAGGDSGPVIEQKSPAGSLLIQALRHEGLEMPPDGKLPEKVIADFEEWVRIGAPDPRTETAKNPAQSDEESANHWAFQPVVELPVPQVTRTDWPRSNIDRFILAKLESHGLTPADPADRRTWLRRVSFAITGLPPTLEDIDAFLQDTSPAAYERVADRLLASPQMGERWARHWMDLVRYAESRGHEADYIIPNAYQYRDYLIRAFNADVPYDQFVIEHLAGDLVRPPRLHPRRGFNESILGSGWAFLGEEMHAPVDIRQDELERIDNKIDVLSKTFLGLTVACARCHDHKFDPISQEDYYALSGFILSSSYRQVRFESMEHNRRIAAELASLREEAAEEITRATAEAQRPWLKQLGKYLTATGNANKRTSLDRTVVADWIKVLQEEREEEFSLLSPLAKLIAVVDEKQFRTRRDKIVQSWQARFDEGSTDPGRVIVDYAHLNEVDWIVDGFSFGPRPVQLGDLGFGESETHPVNRVFAYGVARRDPFWNDLTIPSDNEKEGGLHDATSRSGRMVRTPTFTLNSGRVFCLMRGPAKVYAGVDSHIMVRPPRHHQLIFEIDSDRKSEAELRWVPLDLSRYMGHRVHLEFGPRYSSPLEVLKIVESDRAPQWASRPNRLVLQLLQSNSIRSRDDLIEAYQRLFLDVSEQFGAGTIRSAGDSADVASLANWLVEHPDLIVPPQSPQRRQLATLCSDFVARQAKLKQEVREESHTAIAWLDGNGVNERVLKRGSHRTPGELVARRLPEIAATTAPSDSHGSGRLKMARRLVDPSNPFVARVMVNRVWHHLFGRGIVPSVDNFGLLGETPSHRELLDHLTYQFMQVDGWSIKKLIRRIVLSKTYGMSSLPVDERAEEIDPENALLHRASVRRLEAEAVRDLVLAVSGRLDPTMFGPQVPVHLTEFVFGRSQPRINGPLDGAGRRSVYLAVRRNFLPTMMMAFDAPIPFSSVGRRSTTNVPGQSLVLMNDPFIYQQADYWARQLVAEKRTSESKRCIHHMYRVALGRPPADNETTACLETITELARLHDCEKEDLVVWTDLAHAIFGLNEFIYVR